MRRNIGLSVMTLFFGIFVLALDARADSGGPKLVEQKISNHDKGTCSAANYLVHFTVQAHQTGSFKYKFIASDGSETREFTWHAKSARDRLVTSHSFKPAGVRHGETLWFGIQFEADASPQHLSTATAHCKD